MNRSPERPGPRMRRRAVAANPADLVSSAPLDAGQPLPLVLRPLADVDLVAWAGANRDRLDRALLEHGTLLFRGFSVPSPEVFERLALVFVPELLDYVEGSSPRTLLASGIYTSTEYPPDQFISLHSELSYAHRWPARLFFHCRVAPASGGETPLADCSSVLELLPPELVGRFASRGVRYVRNMHAGQGPGLSWSDVYETDDRDFVERYCREGDVDFRWKPDGGLWSSQVRPAIIVHPRTGERVWFNQADQWHPSNLGHELAHAVVAAGRDELPLDASYGDGTPFADGELDQVRDAFRRAMVTFPWQVGDVLMV
ncbi:MAG TPA: TauD/TfdA family dioxygenase, partial [Candidatus Eisenbacteria bacterium]|nr:TauD/TfdA family dioxygenase [Candidatus Eisenbacteria bacterium]